MKYFIYVPGMPFDGDVINKPNFSLGGSETMGYYAGKELAARGHQVFMFCNLIGDKRPRNIDGVQYVDIGPTNQQFPFGQQWEHFAKSVPCDVILAQRNPSIFAKKYNSKINLWWTHDLALKRFQGHINSQLWNVDKILAVSEFHRKQVVDVYGLDDRFTGVFRNGIDLSLWPKSKINPEEKIGGKTLLYSHRPERGLINLVCENGIMEQLYKIDPEIRLLVCGYDNTTQEMAGFYNYLYGRCQMLPNVQNIGHLSKQQLADMQAKVWLHIYPTEFEEVSCITVMEQQAAGTPVIATPVAALPETLKDGGVYWKDKEGFVGAVKYLQQNPGKWMELHKLAMVKRDSYDIKKSIDDFESTVDTIFTGLTKDCKKLYKHFVHHSDIKLAQEIAKTNGIIDDNTPALFETITEDLEQTKPFYDAAAERCSSNGNTHNIDNPDAILRMPRIQPVVDLLGKLPAGSKVLDYGCCVGQETFAFKKRFPSLEFVGVDISIEQIEVAKSYAKNNSISGVSFYQANSPLELVAGNDVALGSFDVVICLEVLEHIWNHTEFLLDLTKLLKEGGRIILSTPYGAYDMNSDDPHPMYQHLHNFEEQDIADMVRHKPEFNIIYAEDAPSKRGEFMGCYIWSWKEDFKEPIRPINYKRKMLIQSPRQTIACCMILEKDSPTITKTLRSIEYFVDEIIIGIDDPDWYADVNSSPTSEREIVGYTDDFIGMSYEPLNRMHLVTSIPIRVFPIASPRIQGFDAARNETIENVESDWILWIDDDEDLVWANRLRQFVRNNIFDSYGIPQHHLSADPLGVLKTDYPCRLFRNGKGIRFFGVVHEHPETAINCGAGRTMLMSDNTGAIMHNAYDTEDTRRSRFIRNFPLMEKDRKKYPDRKLGQMLWLRDLAHMNRFEFERVRQVTPTMEERAKEAISLWRKILSDSNARMLKETIPYISECVDIVTKGGGIHFRLALDVNNKGIGDNLQAPIDVAFTGKVETKEDVDSLYKILVKEKLDVIDSIKYI